MFFGGELGERDPQSRHRGGSRVGALRVPQESRSPVSPAWHSAGRGCHTQALPELGDPHFDPGAPRLPFPVRLRARSAGALGEPLAPVRTATCQSHFLKQTTIHRGTATRGHRAPPRALPLLPSSGTACTPSCTPKAPRVHGRGSQPSPRRHPEAAPRDHILSSQPECAEPTPPVGTPTTHPEPAPPEHLQLPPARTPKPPQSTHPACTPTPPMLPKPPGGIPLPRRLPRGPELPAGVAQQTLVPQIAVASQ